VIKDEQREASSTPAFPPLAPPHPSSTSPGVPPPQIVLSPSPGVSSPQIVSSLSAGVPQTKQNKLTRRIVNETCPSLGEKETEKLVKESLVETSETNVEPSGECRTKNRYYNRVHYLSDNNINIIICSIELK